MNHRETGEEIIKILKPHFEESLKKPEVTIYSLATMRLEERVKFHEFLSSSPTPANNKRPIHPRGYMDDIPKYKEGMQGYIGHNFRFLSSTPDTVLEATANYLEHNALANRKKKVKS